MADGADLAGRALTPDPAPGPRERGGTLAPRLPPSTKHGAPPLSGLLVPGEGAGRRGEQPAADLTVVAEHLTKVYRVQKKAPGLLASVRALVKRDYTDVRAVDDITLAIGRGELIGFLGPNGAGKTTTLKMMAGLLEPTDGRVRVRARPHVPHAP